MAAVTPDLKRWQVWLLAARPKTLWAALSPVLIGGALAADADHLHLLAWLAAAVGAILIQIGTNFANDLFDYEKQTDTEERLGPLRVTQAGLVTPKQMRVATALVFVLALMVGIYLVYRGGWPIVAIGLLSILFGVLYTAGPYPLGYNGLGDIFVLIFFGPVAVGGTYYVMALDINTTVLLAGLPPGLLAVAILVVNNLRDIDSDRKGGKRTLAVRFGLIFTRVQYLLMLLLALSFAPLHYLITGAHAAAMLSLMALLPALGPLQQVFTSRDGTVLNNVLAATGKVLFVYALTFSVGWML
ncbi:MAG: 1,4-dihydroxy-2-naphthoate polyprenyltransferase [bacterium]